MWLTRPIIVIGTCSRKTFRRACSWWRCTCPIPPPKKSSLHAADAPVLGPGGKVKLTVEVTPARNIEKVDVLRNELRKRYEQMIGANGWVQDNAAPLELKLSLKEQIGGAALYLLRSPHVPIIVDHPLRT